MISPSFIQDLLGRVDIADVVGRYVKLKKSGANHMGLCPFHGEKSPSFSVSPSRQTYHCFVCGVHGNAIGFLMEHSGMGFVDAVQDLAQQVGLAVPQDDRGRLNRHGLQQRGDAEQVEQTGGIRRQLEAGAGLFEPGRPVEDAKHHLLLGG